MRYLLLIAIIFLGTGLMAQSQNNPTKRDTASFKIEQIQESDISILFSYYSQDGNNSPVTGGIGTEKLADYTSKIIVNLVLDEKQSISLDGGFDYYTSASTDNIDRFVSSASSSDMRVHGNIGYSRKAANDLSYGIKVGGSGEYDYSSVQFSGYVSKISANGTRSYGLSAQAFLDKWSLIYPQELRGQNWADTDLRRSYSVSGSFTQVLNKRMQIGLTTDLVKQTGLLSTPFHRVYFNDLSTVRVEKLPAERLKVPIGLRFNYYVNDFLLLRTYYRYYWDNWGVTAHTAQVEIPVKINRFFSVYPFYRFHTQSAADYFSPYQESSLSSEFYTSDYDLSKLTSHDYGLGVRYSPANGIGSMKLPGTSRILTFKEINLKYGHYTRSTGLKSNIISFGMNFTF